jgi:3-hydroxyisobutyrate dehydrogenase
VGSGQAIKLVNQMLVALHTTAASEAAAFAVGVGADLATVQHVIGTSFGSSAMLLRNLPRYIARDFSPATPVVVVLLIRSTAPPRADYRRCAST